jgi:phosphatidylinositol glycan class B
MALLALALALRVAALFAFPSVHHPDETFQLFERAHRLAFGYGVKPWEFEDGLRSYVPPYILAGLFKLSEPIFGGPEGYIHFAQIALALFSLLPVAAIYQMGRRISPTHGLIAGVVAATWCELVYFSFRPLTEALATDFILVALALASIPFAQMSRRRVMAIGCCLGLAAMLRIHFAPGLLFIGLWVVRLEFRSRWTALILGAIPPLLIFGLTDLVTWGAPFRSQFQAIWVNAVQHKASQYGVMSFFWYARSFMITWGVALVPLALLVALRLRSSPLWIGFAVIVVASHSLIPHKEYRFIYAAAASLVVVAALGSADVLIWLRARYGADRTRWAPAVAAVLWMAISASATSLLPTNVHNWTRGRGAIKAAYWLARQPDLCGLALYQDSWADTGGYAYLHRNVPTYALRAKHDQAHRTTQAFNYVLGRRSDLAGFQPTYRLAWCADDGEDPTCLLARPGACVAAPALTSVLDMRRLGDGMNLD